MTLVVGIDLGTTHSVLAFSAGGPDEAELFEVPQLVDAGRAEARPLLPSALFAPVEGEGTDTRFRLEGEAAWICGEQGRRRAGEVPQRGVLSAKSWLSYPQVDRRAAILPWQLAGDPGEGEGEEGTPRISPVDAASLVLAHLQQRWDEAHPEDALAQQEVVLTVPASFDAVARQLTVEAARSRGLDVRLLEEPQAAFYDLWRRGGDAVLAEAVVDGEGLVLVVDVGGGTTDLSLIAVRGGGDDLQVERVAVGKHLLLGGDNMDLALAHLCEQRLKKAGKLKDRLPERRFARLVAACRDAKEKLLGDEGLDEVQLSIERGGSQLVGSVLRTTLTRDEVRQVVLDGFFPEVDASAEVSRTRGGIVAFGLPFERDVAITRHVAEFLRRSEAEGTPTAVLLNGGVFRSPAVADRLCAVVGGWLSRAPARLDITDPDTSVAFGAVAYGLARRGQGRRIAGGAPRSFFLGVGGTDTPSAVCVLPRGTEEEQTQRIEGDFALTVGKKVRFDFYAADARDEVGAVVPVGDRFDRLAPLVTELRGEGKRVDVDLEAELTAVGTLELSCVERGADAPRRFALAFDVRAEGDAERATHEEASAQRRYGQRLEEATEAIEAIYSKRTRQSVKQSEVKSLLRRLEKIFGKRRAWEATLIRALYDLLWRHHKGRRTSVEHERVFWMLGGFCLRPGVGHARDEERAAALFKLFEQGLAHHDEKRSWEQFWICWRRVAAGLDEKAQKRLRDVVDPFVAPAEVAKKQPKKFRNEAFWEMLELAAALERVPAQRRGELGGWILERTWTERDHRLWAALGRVGARVPTYGSAHQVVAARTVERWMDHLLREKWEEIPSAPNAAVAMCRLTGDRARDLSEATRAKVDAKLAKIGVDEERRRPILELVAIDDEDRAAFYGEDLPAGLVWGS